MGFAGVMPSLRFAEVSVLREKADEREWVDGLTRSHVLACCLDDVRTASSPRLEARQPLPLLYLTFISRKAGMSTIELYAELLSNIRTVTFVATLQTEHNDETKVELSADGSTITVSHEGESATINLPTRMSGGGTAGLVLPPRPSKDLTLRLALEEKAPGLLKFQNGNENLTPWPASSFEKSEVLCRQCGASLLKPNRVRDWRDLPSEDWADMMDFWHCHKPHEESHEHEHHEVSQIKGYGSANRLQSVCGVGFVGLSIILVSEQDCHNLRVSFPSNQNPLTPCFAHLFLVSPLVFRSGIKERGCKIPASEPIHGTISDTIALE
jgi:HECT-like Ubiquitin-conjugating enzyme (E2)-binding